MALSTLFPLRRSISTELHDPELPSVEPTDLQHQLLRHRKGWLVVFDNVDFIGNLSCDKVHGNFIWFVNGSITRAHILSCANLFVPVDKIDKENPPGPPFVSIGVPFAYTLTFPQLVSATTGAVVNPNGSNVEVDQVTVTDNLNATGVSLSYVKSSAAWKGSGAPVPFAAHERKRAAHVQRFSPRFQPGSRSC